MEIKIRYTFKRKSDGHIWQEITSIECLEGKGDEPFVLKYSEAEWDLIGRDLFSGLFDYNNSELFNNDILKRIGTKDIFYGSADDFWGAMPTTINYEILKIDVVKDNFGSTNFGYSIHTQKTYSERTNPATYEKVGDIYTTPELIPN